MSEQTIGAQPTQDARESRLLALQLEAQRALMPHALGMFGVCLPIFVWVGSHAPNAADMALSFAVFAINWGAFYLVNNAPSTNGSDDLKRRHRLQIGAAVLWAAAVGQMAAFASNAGPAREPLLICAVGAAIICLFFTAPSLPALLIVGPVAMAGPLVVLFSHASTRGATFQVWGAFSLAFLLTLILNRSLRRQFALVADLDDLAAARETARLTSERLAKSKSDLISTLSHEIETGLAGVVHVLAAASGAGPRSTPSREQLAAALAAAEDLIAVVGATLDNESAEAGALLVEARAFDAAAVCREAAAPARALAARKGLEFSLFIEPELEIGELGAAVGDPARVRQVIASLLANAVKYAARGRVEIRLQRRGADRLEVEIADTGPGLSPEELDLAFQPFARISRTAAGVPGAGLGLALARRLADLMGARLIARSAVGVGSCFTLDLPFDAGAPRPDTGAMLVELRPDRRLKVLICEEDALSAALLRALLEQLGHQVAHARSGRRAIELAGSLGFDLIMLAVRLPDMESHEALAALREGEAAKIPLVAVIEGDADEADSLFADGVATVVRKPLSVAAVARAVAVAETHHPGAERAVA